MFGPLKYILYACILGAIAYTALYYLPNYMQVQQYETTQNIEIKKPILLNGQ
ncbi:MAG: hypothetical protein HRU29_14730 [Rhizobiales bacterium]|nr:hypothetical protein [Hyphomicrobiales bacterium]NRB15651.1 hypothetical protein [Hyphomicrobiales bacterium]